MRCLIHKRQCRVGDTNASLSSWYDKSASMFTAAEAARLSCSAQTLSIPTARQHSSTARLARSCRRRSTYLRSSRKLYGVIARRAVVTCSAPEDDSADTSGMLSKQTIKSKSPTGQYLQFIREQQPHLFEGAVEEQLSLLVDSKSGNAEEDGYASRQLALSYLAWATTLIC